ncbi:MAG: NADH-quinone oxidoreductase subunit D-related protein, partial [Xanthobacteraceae bacterium]
LLARPLSPARCSEGGAPVEIAVARVESPRGATVCALERAGDRLGRFHLHSGSYANWPVLASVAPGELLPDFPLINKSFELCYACADR